MGMIDILSFGSESGNIEELWQLADHSDIGDERTVRSDPRRSPKWPHIPAGSDSRKKRSVPASPNDILAVEYLKALKEFSSEISPWTLKRSDPGYHSEVGTAPSLPQQLSEKQFFSQDSEFLAAVLPDSHFECMKEESEVPLFPNDFSLLLNQKILTSDLEKLQNIFGMPEILRQSSIKTD